MVPVYFLYAFKVAICLSVTFLFYALFLRRMTYYNWNRYFLLISSIGSFLIPIVHLDFFSASAPGAPSFIDHVSRIPALSNGAEVIGDDGMIVYWKLLSAVFVLVSAILLIRLLIQFLSIRLIRKRGKLIHDGAYRIYDISTASLPFSFGRNIYIQTARYSEAELQKIINHERVHVQQRHSIDMLVAELICVVNWYNPIAWLIKNSIRQNLEFIADQMILTEGFDKKNYQYLLLKVSGDLPASFATGLQGATLRNRILMMNKVRTAPFQLFKFLLILPVTAILLIAFRNGKDVPKQVLASTGPVAEKFVLSRLTYAIADGRVRSIVVQEQANAFLKAGQPFSLSNIQAEKDRLNELLQRNGYTQLKPEAIRFMIDTATVKNNFSVEVSIDVTAAAVAARGRAVYKDAFMTEAYQTAGLRTAFTNMFEGAGGTCRPELAVTDYGQFG